MGRAIRRRAFMRVIIWIGHDSSLSCLGCYLIIEERFQIDGEARKLATAK